MYSKASVASMGAPCSSSSRMHDRTPSASLPAICTRSSGDTSAWKMGGAGSGPVPLLCPTPRLPAPPRLCIEKQPAGADIAALARKPQRCHDGAVGPDLAPDVDVGARLDKRAGALLARMAVASHMHHQSAVQQRDLPRDARQRDELRQLGATRLPHQLPEPARLPTPENQRQLGGSDGRLRQLVPGAASGQLGWFGAQVGRPDREPAHAGGRADLHAIPPPALVEAEDPGDSPVELRSRLQTHHRGAQARRQASAVVICRAERVLCA